MEVKNVNTVMFPSPNIPEGITADIHFDGGVKMSAYRPWKDVTWYIEEVFIEDFSLNYSDYIQPYPLPLDGVITVALDRAVEDIRQEYSPA